jgi:hypothetical protein
MLITNAFEKEKKEPNVKMINRDIVDAGQLDRLGSLSRCSHMRAFYVTSSSKRDANGMP